MCTFYISVSCLSGICLHFWYQCQLFVYIVKLKLKNAAVCLHFDRNASFCLHLKSNVSFFVTQCQLVLIWNQIFILCLHLCQLFVYIWNQISVLSLHLNQMSAFCLHLKPNARSLFTFETNCLLLVNILKGMSTVCFVHIWNQMPALCLHLEPNVSCLFTFLGNVSCLFTFCRSVNFLFTFLKP